MKEYVGIASEQPKTRESILGDIIIVGLRDDFRKYDFYWPIIVRDKDETLVPVGLSLNKLEQFPLPLETLKKLIPKNGDEFYSEEVTVRTRFGKYAVNAEIFNASSYNEFISKLINGISSMLIPIGRKDRVFPRLQVNNAEIARLVDEYIRHRFSMKNLNQWLMITGGYCSYLNPKSSLTL